MTRAEDVDLSWVEEKRRVNAGWPAIARMAGVSEEALRRRFDTRYVSAPRRPANPREAIRLGLVRAAFAPDQALMLSRLWHANGSPLKAPEVTRGIIGHSAATSVASEMRRAAIRRGIAFSRECRNGYVLSAEGKRAVETLAGVVASECPT